MRGLARARHYPRIASAVLLGAGLLAAAAPLRAAVVPTPTHAAPVASHLASTDLALSQAPHPDLSLAHLPLLFEQDRQGKGAIYVAHGSGFTMILTSGGPVLIGARPAPRTSLEAPRQTTAATVRFQMLGANPTPNILGLDKQEATANYLMGANPKAWRTGVPTFGRILYRNVYPGISATYYGNQGDLEYDFTLAPGANPHQIRLAFPGANTLSIDHRGNLIISSVLGTLIEKAPVIYQRLGESRQAVSGHYLVGSGNTVTFALGRYDQRRALTIDPVLSYSNLDGSNDVGSGIAIDRSGNAYVVGTTYSTIITQTVMLRGYPAAAACPAGSQNPCPNVFVAKFNPRGNKLLYTTYLNGTTDAHSTDSSPYSYGTGIAVDAAGDAFIVGYSNATDFPTTPRAFQTDNRGGYDVFVAKLSPSGHFLTYSTLLGGTIDNAGKTGDDIGEGIAVDHSGYAYVTGYTYSYNFPLKNALQGALGYGKGTLGQQVDAFVTKFNPQGTNVVYSTYLGGSGSDTASAIAIDPSGDAYVTGQTNSPDFPAPPHALQPHLAGADYNSFVAKLNKYGNALVYATYLGQSAADKTHGIAVDTVGNAYVVGETNGGIPRTLGAPQPISGGGVDAFVSKLSARGVLIYSTYLGGAENDVAYGVAVDGRGNAYIAGSTGSASFNTPVFPLKAALQGTLGGNRGGFGMLDAFVAKVNSCGSGLLYSSYFGGTFVDSAQAIAVDGAGNAYVTGSTVSPNFPLTHTLPGGRAYIPAAQNTFIAKISGAPQPPRGACPLPLTLGLSTSEVSISAATPLTVTVRTAPFAHVEVSLVVKNTVPPPPPPPTPTPVKGKKSPPVKQPTAPKVGQIIYHKVLKGTADAYGLYIGAFHPKFVESVAEIGTLAVHTFASSSVANTATQVTISP